tara:strand:+ start:183 stop:383 length:201 start_codon:yes stop_codon:yes gene_type:complete
MSFNKIFDPVTNAGYNLYSSEGKQLLKHYVKLLKAQSGGSSCQSNTVGETQPTKPTKQLKKQTGGG